MTFAAETSLRPLAVTHLCCAAWPARLFTPVIEMTLPVDMVTLLQASPSASGSPREPQFWFSLDPLMAVSEPAMGAWWACVSTAYMRPCKHDSVQDTFNPTVIVFYFFNNRGGRRGAWLRDPGADAGCSGPGNRESTFTGIFSRDDNAVAKTYLHRILGTYLTP